MVLSRREDRITMDDDRKQIDHFQEMGIELTLKLAQGV